ncbi:MAG: hypothetical protein C4308_00165 [Chitinophagaceae bacterium]
MEDIKSTATQIKEDVKSATEEIKKETTDLFDHATDYLDTFIKLKTVTVTEKAVNVISGVINAVIFLVLGLVAFLFLATGLAIWLGDLLYNRAAGFFIVAGFLLLMIAVISFMRKKTILPLLRNIVTKKFYG